RGWTTAASLVHGGSSPQTPLCAGSLAIASPTADEGNAGHACTDFQKGGYQRTCRFCLSRRIRLRSREVPVSGRCAPHHFTFAAALHFPASCGRERVVRAARLRVLK